jgi:RND superfamily putative drug exporter
VGWARVGNSITRRPRLIWIGTSLLLVAMAAGVTQLDANGLRQTFTGKPDSVRGQEALQRHFTAGSANTAVVIAAAGSAEPLTFALQETPGVAAVSAAQRHGDYVQLDATLQAAPNSAEAYRTIERIRGRVDSVPGANALVGGAEALNLDIQAASRRDRQLIIPLVLVVILVLLMLLLRAVVAPVLLMASVVLSFLAALGGSAIVFENVFHFDGADSSFPLIAFIFLVALGIDYNIFLMTRVREETIRFGTQPGVFTLRFGAKPGMLHGLAVTGGVITSAGAVLAATFAALGVLPVVFLVQLGFAVGFGVMLDTLLVRSLLIPALAIDLGPRIWWPGKLSHMSLPRHSRFMSAPVSQPDGAAPHPNGGHPNGFRPRTEPATPDPASRPWADERVHLVPVSLDDAADAREQIRRLQRENRILREERNTLRRALAIVAKTNDIEAPLHEAASGLAWDRHVIEQETGDQSDTRFPHWWQTPKPGDPR